MKEIPWLFPPRFMACDVLSQNIKRFMDSEVKLWLNWQYIFNVVLALKVMNEIKMKTLL